MAAARAAKLRTVTARRLVEVDVHNKAVVTKLFETIAPRFEGRAGGYTRLLKVGNRRGDNAEVAQIELVGSEYNPALDKPEAEVEAPKAKGVRGRLQAAASRLRGEKKDADDAGGGGETKQAQDRPQEGRHRRRPDSSVFARARRAQLLTPCPLSSLMRRGGLFFRARGQPPHPDSWDRAAIYAYPHGSQGDSGRAA